MVSTDDAGPSRPRTPPLTPNRKELRRRSWFGLMTPSPRKDRGIATTREGPLPSTSDELELTLVRHSDESSHSITAQKTSIDTNGTSSTGSADEVLTIDGGVESTVKRKKRPKKDLEGEVVRMDDLSMLSRQNTVKPTKPSSHRVFSRSASDRDPFDSDLIPPVPRLPSVISPSKVPRRSSSITSPAIPVVDLQPPPLPELPGPRKPLPPLPVPAEPPPLIVPTGIVVTPSSPHTSDPFDNFFAGGEAVREDTTPRSGSRSSSRTRNRESSRPSTLGLGLPGKGGRSSSPSDPLPTPSKQQAVSSPLPVRSHSPIPKVTFISPDGKVRGRREEKDTIKVTRARSLSGVFSRSSVALSDQTDEEGAIRPQGVLNWLGVRKTVRRRQSETKLKSLNDTVSETESGNETISIGKGRRGSARSPQSPLPLIPSKTMTVGAAPLPHLGSRPVDIVGTVHSANSQSTTSSSQSSLVLAAAVESPSPYWNSGAWTASPSTELEEMLFQEGGSNWGPGMRPWLDPSISQHPSVTSIPSLGSLPEAGLFENASSVTQEGRLRSWSDAPFGMSREGSLPLSSSPRTLLGESGRSPVRPKMGSRSSSNNSAIFGKVRNVFGKSASRNRSNSMLRHSSDVDEFGAVQEAPHMRPSSSSSSFVSPGLPPVRIRPEEVPQVSMLTLQIGEGDRRVVLNEVADQSPRSSYTPSMSSRASLSTRRSTTADSHPTIPTRTAARARASTIAAGQSSYLPPPQPPSSLPAAATPPRQRPGSIRRLSNGLFRTNPSSPKPSSSLFPLPSRSSGSISSPNGFGSASNEPSPRTSPRPSVGSVSATVLPQNVTILEGETPVTWLERLASLSRRDVAGVLAASADAFHNDALKLFMSRFDFTHTALDVALRRLLMHMSLPKETQQIDRIVEAFANRFDDCEPGLFGAKDNAYILSFSMMMLHTDAFNRHNKNKMTKSDYVRNTRLDGVPSAVLEAFYDNITFTPFVFIEDDLEATLATGTANINNPAPRSGKIDVYDLIVSGRIGSLRVDVEHYIPAESPYSCFGTRPFLNIDGLQQAFAEAQSLEIVATRPRRKSSAASVPLSSDKVSKVAPVAPTMVLKITKVGLLSRKEDNGSATMLPGRKWKNWSVILTGSQLLFFKDTMWALTLLEQMRSANDSSGVLPRTTGLKPDEVFPVKDCIAVYDREYARYPNTFRFVMPHGRQYLMQASDEFEMNEWISLINYASTFKTAGIRMRALGIESGQVVMAGAAAAASHLRDLENVGHQTGGASKAVAFAPSTEKANRVRQTVLYDVDVGNDVIVGDGERLEQVFDIVKAELAAGRGQATRTVDSESPSARTSRVDAIQAQSILIKQAAAPIEKRLTANLRVARNLAILTPFQKSTRERVEATIPELAQLISADRLNLAKLHLWLTVLLKDQERDEREWARLRHVALQAAAKSLREPDGPDAVPETISEPVDIPKLALPDEDWDDKQTGSSPGELPVVFRRPSDEEGLPGLRRSSDFDLAQPLSTEHLTVSSALTPRDELETPYNLVDGGYDETKQVIECGEKSVGRNDEAEEWQNTRAATRVSLATILPEELGILSQKLKRGD